MMQGLILIASVAVLYGNWTGDRSFLIGAVGLALYYGVNSITWGEVLERILPLGRAWGRVFGFLVSFYLSAMAIGIPVVVWKYDRIAVAGMLLLVGLAGVVISALRNRHAERSGVKTRPFDFVHRLAPHLAQSGVVLFLFLLALFVFFIFHARTGVFILSPWGALSSFILILFFALAFLVARFVFSGRPAGVVLTLIILFSYAAHLYLPAVYKTGFGGDKWRHLGAEIWLQEGNIYTPSVWGEKQRSMAHFGPLAVPEALVAGNKTSYSPQWASTIFLAESLGVDIFWVDLLLVFLLWSLFLPLILFQFGRLIFKEERLGLLFAFLPILFYTFQSEGAITIPVSFGHLFFFFILLLWAHYIKEGRRSSLAAAAALSLAFYWGYILNFFVLIIVGVLSVAWRVLFMERMHWYTFKLKYGFSDRRLSLRDKTLFGLLAAAAVLIIPFLEIFQGLSGYAAGSVSISGVVNALADAFGRLSGFISIVVPPDFIDQGNFLYNQTKESLSRLPLFSYRLVPFIVSMGAWTVIVWAMYRLFRYHRAHKTWVLIAVLFLVALGSYFISFSFTEGVHILARRLNETIVFFMILFLGRGIWQLISPSFTKEGVRGWLAQIPHRKRVLAISFLLAFAATSTYASGPKLQMVTADELAAARLVWSEHQKDPEPYCVIANTWPLLGLEAVSGKKITAGNFPVYQEYAQPERVKIFEGLSKSPSRVWLDGAFRITNASVCYYMTEGRWINDRVLEKTLEMLGEPKRVGEVYLWRIEKSLE